MAKKKAETEQRINLTDAQKRMDQYVKACEKQKKGRRTALSLILIAIVCLLFLLVIGLKINGIGFTAAIKKDGVNIVSTDTVEATRLADVVNN